MRLWNKSYGKESKAKDFTGRVMAKAAYNDRNSEFGWNLDHVLPQSRGGKTAEHNLICCHIKTNDEKADKFPGFKANGIAFEIIKVENHYEIRRVNKNKGNDKPEKEENPDKVNFMDSASGVRFFKKLKGIQNKKKWVSSILVRLRGLESSAVVEFIEEMFDTNNFEYYSTGSYYGNEIQIMIRNYNVPLKENLQVLLDECVLLNTYLKSYFLEAGYIDSYDIYYSADCFDDKFDMCENVEDVSFIDGLTRKRLNNMPRRLANSMYVNNLVICNTNAKGKVEENAYGRMTEYDYVYTKLQKNLNKEVNGR